MKLWQLMADKMFYISEFCFLIVFFFSYQAKSNVCWTPLPSLTLTTVWRFSGRRRSHRPDFPSWTWSRWPRQPWPSSASRWLSKKSAKRIWSRKLTKTRSVWFHLPFWNSFIRKLRRKNPRLESNTLKNIDNYVFEKEQQKRCQKLNKRKQGS